MVHLDTEFCVQWQWGNFTSTLAFHENDFAIVATTQVENFRSTRRVGLQAPSFSGRSTTALQPRRPGSVPLSVMMELYSKRNLVPRVGV
jgi:hypothetical protein